MPTQEFTNTSHPLQKVFDRYHASWEARSPDRIAQLHSEQTLFWMHDGSEASIGRDALRQKCAGMFARFNFTFEPQRIFFGESHWTLEWTMCVDLKDKDGRPFLAKVEMLDVVTLNPMNEVERKDVYLNGAQAQAAFARAGIGIDRGIKY